MLLLEFDEYEVGVVSDWDDGRVSMAAVAVAHVEEEQVENQD